MKSLLLGKLIVGYKLLQRHEAGNAYKIRLLIDDHDVGCDLSEEGRPKIYNNYEIIHQCFMPILLLKL